MRTTAFPVKHRLQNLLSCKIPLCFYCLSVLGCVSQCVRISGGDGRQANDPKPVQSHWCCTLTHKRTPVPLVPMTPRKISSLQSYQTGLWAVSGSLLGAKERLHSTNRAVCRGCVQQLFSSFLFPLT